MSIYRRRDFIAVLGGAAAWPVLARGQQPAKVPHVGLLTTGSIDSPETQANLAAFLQGLYDLGYTVGQNIVIERRAADGNFERLPGLATELVGAKVDLIVAAATPAGLAAQQATTTIPIVVTVMGDPVKDGLVTSLARPAGNITGTTFLGPELVPKRLALLKELLPKIIRVAALSHPEAFSERTVSGMLAETAEAATTLGLHVQHLEVRKPDDLNYAFSKLARDGAEAVFQLPSTMLFNERKRIVHLVSMYRIPSMFNAREFVQLGGLIGYGASIGDMNRRAATYVDRILKGAKPGELPVEQPTKFELYINLKTAKALGITVAPTLLARADEVIG
jgi:putative ABC transport system substrate-binding protein